MSVSFLRPNATELVFHLYGRSIHPELFDIHAEKSIEQPEYSANVRICQAGHVVSFTSGGETVTEVTAARRHPLPQRKRVLEKKLRGSRDESIELDHGLTYHISYQLEQLDPEVFLNFNEELLMDSRRADLAHRFPGGNRLAPSPISIIQTDVWPHSLLIHAFHTYPDSCALVKTQSLFELQ
ncbi:MAG: DUF2617 domain-containing protein [Planctomycetaceae bacterium]|nr:DUF2617 domain-containing protein [Planctomycetaceae bacterium]